MKLYSPYNNRLQIEEYQNDGSTSFNLVFPSAKPEDAGTYICRDNQGSGEMSSAEITVLAPDRNGTCQSNMKPDGVVIPNDCNIDPDEVQLSCGVTFYGNNPPQLEWKKVPDSGNSVAKTECQAINNRVVCNTSIVGDRQMNRSSYVCETAGSSELNINLCTIEVKNLIYFVLLTAVGTLAAFSGVVTTILCIRMKRSSSASDPVTTPAKEEDRPISTVGQTAVSRSSIFYDIIDDEIIIPTQTVQDTTTLSALHPGSRASFAGDSLSSCTIHRISAFDRRYVNAGICTSNHQTHAAFPVPNPDLESPTPGTNNCPADQDGDTKQSYSECEDAPYTRVVAQVGRTDTYEPLQPSSARDPNFDNTDAAT